ncbi:NADH-quinone oxidoreductase subunit J [Roseococcus sp. YIM B11640]|uniref:NADH-quinone oxidoreductase subunit J n=1 Tax=Roseococcus sp. YIM B11640 TaxID=3133973 RepID=UPI003C7C2A29
MIAALAFYLFAFILIASAVMVVTSRNPVHSVLYLILAFFNAAALFLIAGAEFLAMTLVIVYVGAVAVLFLFVVMMLDVDFVQLREGFQRYAPIGAIIGGILFLELLLVFGAWQFSADVADLRLAPTPEGVSNTHALGRVIYTDYIFLFQASGLILLVAMIGAIVLTLRDKHSSKRQNIAAQVSRSPELLMAQPAIGQGIRREEILRPLPPPVKEVAAPHGHDDDHHDHGHGTHGGGHH